MTHIHQQLQIRYPTTLPVRLRNWTRGDCAVSHGGKRHQLGKGRPFNQPRGAAGTTSGTFPVPCKTSDLPAPDGLAAKSRYLRLQTCTRRTHGPGLSGRIPERPHVRIHFRHPETSRNPPTIHSVRPVGIVAFRCRTQPSEGGGRHLLHPFDEHRPVQPRACRTAALYRIAQIRTSVHGVMGHLRARHRKPGSARALWC
jgi:hypothetical protein